jgi:hypothetical protein
MVAARAALTIGSARPMLAGIMISGAYVYRAADRLITRYGAEALNAVNRLICKAIGHRDQDRALLIMRIRLAIMVLQGTPTGPLH